MKMNRFVLQNTIPQPIRFGSMVFLASIIFLTPHSAWMQLSYAQQQYPATTVPVRPALCISFNQKDEREKKDHLWCLGESNRSFLAPFYTASALFTIAINP